MAPSSMGAYREEKRSLSTQCVGCSVVDRVGAGVLLLSLLLSPPLMRPRLSRLPRGTYCC